MGRESEDARRVRDREEGAKAVEEGEEGLQRGERELVPEFEGGKEEETD